MKKSIIHLIKENKQLPYIGLSLLVFIILSVIYFSPVLSGNKLFQNDIMQYKGGAEELVKYRNSHDGEDSYWSNSMFGGMPTYQSGAQYPYNYLAPIDKVFGLFLPRPISYFFMMFAGFFLLGYIWLKDWKYALLGALFFGLSTYFFQITEAGHNAKVHTIIYFAPFLAGVLLLFKGNYFWGFILATLAMALQLYANHPQMTFYLLICLSSLGIYYLIQAIRSKKWMEFIMPSILTLVAIFIAVGMNSTRILSTYEYGEESTRGQSEVVSEESTEPKEGLDYDYITDWSYGKFETLNLMIPKLMGGGNHEKDFEPHHFNEEQASLEQQFNVAIEPYRITADSLQLAMQNDPGNPVFQMKIAELQKNIQQVQNTFLKRLEGYSLSYWGEQPPTSGPVYIGVIVCLLAILSLFWIQSPYKYWLIGATLLSFFMAWGKNFPAFTEFMVNHFPFYNKFRAVSSAMVVAELTIPILAMLGMYSFVNNKDLKADFKKKTLLYIGGGFVLVLLILYFFGNNILDFANSKELENMSAEMLEAIKLDRFEYFKKDILRTGLFAVLALLALFAYQQKKLENSGILLGIIALLSVIDLWGVNRSYLNNDSFIPAKYMNNPFRTELTDKMLADANKQPKLNTLFQFVNMNAKLKEIKDNDKEVYRFFNTSYSPFNENYTSYFHQSIGGYHAAKLGRFNDLINTYFSSEPNTEVLNMLNAKYIMVGDYQQPEVITNVDTNGNAWFVYEVKVAENANEELNFLADFDSKMQAVVPKGTALEKTTIDSTAVINLESYQPNSLRYTSKSKTNQFGVFSELYYPHGWKATIDGAEVPIIKTNYLLRGLQIPAGEHTVEFTFEPEVITTGSLIKLSSLFVFLLLVLVGYFYFETDKWTKKKSEVDA